VFPPAALIPRKGWEREKCAKKNQKGNGHFQRRSDGQKDKGGMMSNAIWKKGTKVQQRRGELEKKSVSGGKKGEKQTSPQKGRRKETRERKAFRGNRRP